ncbi:MAG: hypothetical protein H6740_15670 [Alphaproteobacteria bacterium]|nr:hypothetical protein [Alphaproteobacteria bacterium]
MIALLLLACAGRDAADTGARFDPLAAAGCEATATLDEGRDSQVDSRTTSTYGPAAEELERRVDQGDDGVIDEVLRWTWDAEGHPLTLEVDEGDDGVVDSAQAFTWTQGLLTRTETDNDGDGVPDQLELRSYDAGERLERLEQDFGADGVVEEVCVFTWQVSSETGSAYVGEAPCEAGGRVLNVRTLQLDEAHRTTRERRDINDGDLIEDSRWAWSDEGLERSAGFERTRREGVSDRWSQVSWYSPEGLLQVELRSWSLADGADSSLEEETSVAWSCGGG